LDKSSGTHYQLIAVTLGLILFAGSISGSASIAFADDDDKEKKKELRDKINQLKDKIEKIKDKKNKCPKKHKYSDTCDNKKPKVKITSPEKKEKVAGPAVMITGTASDEISGIKKIVVKVDRGPFMETSFDGNVWEITIDLDPGKHKITVKAVDNANNKKRDHVKFTVIS